MEYKESEVPVINRFSSFTINNEDRVICYSNGENKILYCNTKLFEEFLSYIHIGLSFGEIENKFIERYDLADIKNFICVMLDEGIIDVSSGQKYKKNRSRVLVIGEAFPIEVDDLEFVFSSVGNFLNNAEILYFDYAIIIDDNLSYDTLIELNRVLYNWGKIYSQIRYDGEFFILGPLIVPKKTGCIECEINRSLQKINKKIPESEKLSLDSMSKLRISFEIPLHFKKHKMRYFLEIIAIDIDNFLASNRSKFLDCQYKFDDETMDLMKTEYLPTTLCDFCHAFNQNYIDYKPKEMGLNDLLYTGIKHNKSTLNHSEIQYNVGGLRSKSVDDTERILLSDFDKINAKINISPAIGNPFHDSDIVSCFNSSIEMASSSIDNLLIRKNEGSGKGITEKQAFFSASFELLEHLCLQYRGDIPIINAKYNDVKDIALDLDAFSKTIKNHETAFDDFSPEREIDWVVATSVLNNEYILVPASFVFMYDVDLKGSFFGATSNGAAAGTTLEDAILHGILELIERDAWIIGQSNPYILPVIDYSTIKNEAVRDTLKKIKSLGYDIITRDYTNDIGIPVYRTWIVNKDNYSKYAYMGFGCHISPELAIERSITEAVQVDDWSETGGEVEADMIDLSVLSNSLINIYNQYYLVNRDIFGEPKEIKGLPDIGIEARSTLEAIYKIADIIKEKVGGNIYYVDLSKDGLDTKVVRVIITGDFQMMNIPLLSVTNRLFEFGKNCGYSHRSTTYEELYMGKYQH